jgi:protein-disulfide isomerase
LLLGVLVANSKKDAIDVSKIDGTKLITSGPEADYVYGNKDAKVVLVEYGDFQCPGCGGAYPKLKFLKEEFKDQMAFTFRHFPLTTIHPNALTAASAASAAGKQGKFWEMHNILYENQNAWENLAVNQRGDVFKNYAKQIGLNVETFTEDLSSSDVSRKISTDRALGAKMKVDSTPTIFLNGEKMSTDVVNDLTQKNGTLLKERIEAAIKSTGGTLPKAE